MGYSTRLVELIEKFV